MPKVLFVCGHNSARSQMAEAYLKEFGGDRFEVESAGIEPGVLNPFVVRALAEDGIDISGHQIQGVFDLVRQGKRYNFIIAVCSNEAADRCPVFPGKAKRMTWPFADPSTFTGSDEEIMSQIRIVRDGIGEKVRQFSLEEVSLVSS